MTWLEADAEVGAEADAEAGAEVDAMAWWKVSIIRFVTSTKSSRTTSLGKRNLPNSLSWISAGDMPSPKVSKVLLVQEA